MRQTKSLQIITEYKVGSPLLDKVFAKKDKKL